MWERLDEGTKLKIYKQMRDKSKKKKTLSALRRIRGMMAK
jgi:hypothetical protein